MLTDCQSNGPTLICAGGAPHPHIHLAPHFLHSLDFMASTPSGALSPRATWVCTARLGDSRRRGDSWSLLPKVDPSSSLKNKHPGQQPAAWGWETCFKICACRPCHHAGSGKQAALGQNSFANQSCFREAGGVSEGPLCHDQARMTTSECEWKTTACLPCPQQGDQDMVLFKNNSSFLSKPRASGESLSQDLLVTEVRKQSSQLEQQRRTKSKIKLEGYAASIQK